MSDPFVGEIRVFAGTFAPMDWALCDGQLLQIAQYQALFAVIGTTYGGDGQQTFALPNLKARIPIGQGAGPSLTPRQLGVPGGTRTITLTGAQAPAHSHTANCLSTAGNLNSPAGAIWAATPSSGKGGPAVYAGDNNVGMKADAVEPWGSPTPQQHENQQPFLAMNFIICLNGEWPQRP